ncbi:MAG: hypothetical protein A2Z29_05700 [Chloroflexi bacterium RBG_16_56_11]|nr:MAG: hypothetical protein A2Z29_05700 [Chloroflexi bacterium RBG_16_56_11]
MKQKIKERIEEKPSTGECHHYWVIEVANGPTSFGECKHCGVKKEFLNAFPDFNPLRRSSNPLALPELPAVEVDKGSKS